VTHVKALKKKVSITLDEDIIQRIKLIAERDDRSFSQYINLALREHLENQSSNRKQPAEE
jgi:predicted transcriptional regulator